MVVSIFLINILICFEKNEKCRKSASVKPLCTKVSVETESEKEELNNESCYGEENSKDVDEEFDYGENDTSKSIATDHFSAKPIYSIGYWNDPDNNDNPYASVAILTISGIE